MRVRVQIHSRFYTCCLEVENSGWPFPIRDLKDRMEMPLPGDNFSLEEESSPPLCSDSGGVIEYFPERRPWATLTLFS